MPHGYRRLFPTLSGRAPHHKDGQTQLGCGPGGRVVVVVVVDELVLVEVELVDEELVVELLGTEVEEEELLLDELDDVDSMLVPSSVG